MAERLKTKIVEQEKMVDVVCGPDAYKDLPRLLASTENKQAAGNIWAKPVYGGLRTTQAQTSLRKGQSDQCLCYSLIGRYHILDF